MDAIWCWQWPDLKHKKNDEFLKSFDRFARVSNIERKIYNKKKIWKKRTMRNLALHFANSPLLDQMNRKAERKNKWQLWQVWKISFC